MTSLSQNEEKAQELLKRAYELEDQGDIEAALEACEEALALTPQWGEAHNLHGIILDELGDIEAAIAAYRRAVDLNPNDENARANLEDAEREIRGSNSDQHFNPEVPAHVSQSARETLERAYILESEGEPERALEACQAAQNEAPDWAEVYNFKGILLEELERSDEALAAYRKAVELDPDWKEAHQNLKQAEEELRARPYLEEAYTLEEEGDLEAALSACRTALDQAPHWAEAYNLKGLILDEMGRLLEAIEAYRQALKLDPAFEDARVNLEEAERESQGLPPLSHGGRFARAEEIPDSASELLKNAYQMENLGDYKQALETCDEALALVPNWAEAHNLRGILLEELERSDEAIEAYRQAVELDPDNEDARANLEEAEREREGNHSERLVTVGRYHYVVHAHLAQSRLQAAGIQAIVLDEHTAGLLYGGAVGGIRLQVRESDVERALDLLDEEPEESEESETI